LVEGGTGVNDNGDSYSVNSIGMEAAAAIAYRNLTVYLSPSSQYADARTFSIQSAIDLYGECSEEVIAVTNAWQAVGVGDIFDNAVVAAFDYSNNFFCQIPATIDFTDFSNNANEHMWDFGDGETSNEVNPSHTYTASGVYTVTLEVSGEAGCSTADTLELTDLITIVEEGGPVSPTCSPSSSTTSLFSGIQQFNLLGFDNGSEAADVGYEDFSCTHLSEGTSGTFHDLSVSLYGAEYLKIWIDLDANGAFTESEIIYQSETAENFHVASLLLPSTELYDEPLRLRVMSSSVSSFNACSITSAGQVEDYTLVLLENSDPPSADFIASDLNVQPSESVFYTDLSSNIPDSWEWYFEGGVPESSTAQNPEVTYPEEGQYDVQLIVENEFGTDTILKEDYIAVSNTLIMCEESVTTSITGILYDSGGPDGNYLNNEFCTLLISPGCAQSITLSFDQFHLEGCCDYFRVYDGTDNTAPLLLNTNGSSLPPDVTAESGEMFIQFSSDLSVTYSGWVASWTSETPTDNPIGEFEVSDSNPPLLSEVVFTDESTNFPASWLWDFGDGNTSTQVSPTHVYATPDVYEVTLEVTGETGLMGILRRTIDIQAPVTADFTFEVDPNDFRTIHFMDASEDAVSLLWEFGDGFQFTGMNPSHTYTMEGVYSVALTATSLTGLQDVATLNVTISEGFIPVIKEAGFEDNDPTATCGSMAFDGRDCWRNDLGGVIQITSSPTNSGAQAAKLPAAGDRVGYQRVDVEANTDYTVSFFYTMKDDSPGTLTVAVLDDSELTDLSQVAAATIASTTLNDQSDPNAYVMESISFNSGANTVIAIYFGNEGVECRIDDLAIN
ncbi:MAG: PKD domain-containing protein, partial [Bacteroidota bacterium]